jgi:hypothetical protein
MSNYGQQPPPPPPTGPPSGPGSPGAGPAGVPSGSDAKGFFAALFDLSFSTFVTPMIIKFVYVLAMVVLVLVWLFWLVAAFSQSAGFGVAVLILGPIVLIIYLAFIRMTLEIYFAVVRMSEDINRRLPG